MSYLVDLADLHDFLLEEFLLVHALHVAGDVHLLLGPVDAVRTLELRLLAALPLLVVAQAALEFVNASAGRAVETVAGGRAVAAGQQALAQTDAGAPHDRRRRPSLPGGPLEAGHA